MRNQETCPGCAAEFDSRRALVRSGVPMFFDGLTPRRVQMAVRCPDCGHRFNARALRLFGFLSPAGLRWVLVGLVVLCVLLSWVLPPR